MYKNQLQQQEKKQTHETKDFCIFLDVTWNSHLDLSLSPRSFDDQNYTIRASSIQTGGHSKSRVRKVWRQLDISLLWVNCITLSLLRRYRTLLFAKLTLIALHFGRFFSEKAGMMREWKRVETKEELYTKKLFPVLFPLSSRFPLGNRS